MKPFHLCPLVSKVIFLFDSFVSLVQACTTILLFITLNDPTGVLCHLYLCCCQRCPLFTFLTSYSNFFKERFQIISGMLFGKTCAEFIKSRGADYIFNT